MALLSKAQILSAKLPSVTVDVPQLGGEVRVQAFSVPRRTEVANAYIKHVQEVRAYEEDQAKPEDEREGVAEAHDWEDMVLQVMSAIVDEDGQPLFDFTDYDAFHATVPYATVDAIWREFVDLKQASATDDKVNAKKKRSA